MRFVWSMGMVVALAGCGAELDDAHMPEPGTGPGPGPSGPSSVDPGGNGDPGGMSILTPTQYLTKLAKTQCDQLFACRTTFPATPEEFAAAYGSAATDCYAYALDSFRPAELEGEVSKQRITFDGAAGASCILGFGEPDCGTFWTHDWLWGEACYHVFAGVVPDGGACASDYSCSTTGYCDLATARCGPRPP